MKNFFKYAVVVVALIFAVPAVSSAMSFRISDNPSIGSSEAVAGDMYIMGGNVTSAGNVDGDLVVGGANIVVSGNVGADLAVGGGNITVLSNVGDDARIGGGTVVVAGKVGGDLIVGGGQVTVSGSGVSGDAVIGGGNVRLDASVAGDLLVGGGDVYINSQIGGDVKIEADKVTLGKDALIFGNLTYKSKAEMVKEDGAVVNGTVDFKLLTSKAVSPKSSGIFSGFLVWKFLTLLVCALVVGLVFRRYSKEIAVLAVQRPWFELGRGLVAVVIIPIVSILLFAIAIAAPLGIVGLLGFAIMMIFACILSPVILGSVVYRYFSKRELEISWKSILLGVFLHTLLGFVPFVGFLAQMLLALLALGAMLALKMRIAKEWR